ncbi:hypothetical protein JNR97_28420 [Klebsiella pneumoniae]|nr:hypothetical protein [Klebsiella pneumoniae]
MYRRQTYPDSPERFSIGAPLGRGLRLNRLGIHHERLPPGRQPLVVDPQPVET